MTESDLAALDTLVKSLEAALARGSSAAALDVSSVEKLLTSWPSASRFPGKPLIHYGSLSSASIAFRSADPVFRFQLSISTAWLPPTL